MKHNKNKRTYVFFAMLLLAAVLCTGCTIGERRIYFASKTSSHEVFKIGDLACPQEEAKVYLANYKNLYGNVYGTSLWNEAYDTKAMEGSIKDAVIDHLTKVYVLNVYAQQKEITLSDSEKEKTEKAAKAYYDSLNKAERKYTGASKKEIREMYEHYALAEKVYLQLMDSVDSNVSEDEARVMEANVLFVTDDALASEIAVKLKNGATFERIASSYNEGDSIRTVFGRNTYAKEVDDVVFQLENGEVSEKIKTKGGYYFFECINKYNEELSEENKTKIVEQRQKQAMDDVISTVEKECYSHFNQKRWEKISVSSSADVTTNTFFTTLDSFISY